VARQHGPTCTREGAGRVIAITRGRLAIPHQEVTHGGDENTTAAVQHDAQPIVPGDRRQAALAGSLRASPSAGP
jgi:hypothetical protein